MNDETQITNSVYLKNEEENSNMPVKKKEKIINVWTKKKIASTFIHVSDEYKTCKFDNPWVQ